MLSVKEKYDNEALYYEKVMHRLNYVQSMQKFLLEFALPLPSGAKILDLGCGTGLTSIILRKKYPDAELVGFDFSQSMLNLCKERVPNMKLMCGDFNKGDLALLNGKFALIVSTGALSEYADLGKVLPELFSMLEQNGRLLTLGIRKGLIGWIQSKFWSFQLIGQSNFINHCKKADFIDVRSISIPFRFFPTSLLKFAVVARKSVPFP